MRGEGFVILHCQDTEFLVVVLRTGGTGPVTELTADLRLCDQNHTVTAVNRDAGLFMRSWFTQTIHVRPASVHRIGNRSDDVFIVDKDRGIGRIRVNIADRKIRISVFTAVACDPFFKLIGTVVQWSCGQRKGFAFRYMVSGRSCHVP